MRKRMSPQKYWRLRLAKQLASRMVRSGLGRVLEDYVAQVLRDAIASGAPLQEIWVSEPYSLNDLDGQDITIVDQNGNKHPLQVKSSRDGARRFIKRQGKYRLPKIPVVVAALNDTPQQILDKIGEVMPFLQGFKLEKGDVR